MWPLLMVCITGFSFFFHMLRSKILQLFCSLTFIFVKNPLADEKKVLLFFFLKLINNIYSYLFVEMYRGDGSIDFNIGISSKHLSNHHVIKLLKSFPLAGQKRTVSLWIMSGYGIRYSIF